MKTNLQLHLTVLTLLVIMSMSACAPAATSSVAPVIATTETAVATTVLPNVESPATSVSQTLPVTDRSAAVTASGDSLQADLIAVYQQANPSVVYIIVSDTSSGSGFVYNTDQAGHCSI